MNQKKLALWLKAIIIGVGICGTIVYFGILPDLGSFMHETYPEFSSWHWPWMIFLWCTSIPCFLVLALGWKIAANIGADRSFSAENARLLQRIAWLAAGDTVFFFTGNVVLLFLSMNHPGILLVSLLICFAGVAVTVAAICLSHLVQKAADLQEQSDLTI
jgi:hypothetical protein